MRESGLTQNDTRYETGAGFYIKSFRVYKYTSILLYSHAHVTQWWLGVYPLVSVELHHLLYRGVMRRHPTTLWRPPTTLRRPPTTLWRPPATLWRPTTTSAATVLMKFKRCSIVSCERHLICLTFLSMTVASTTRFGCGAIEVALVLCTPNH